MLSGISGEGLFTAHWVEVLKLGGSPVSGHVGLVGWCGSQYQNIYAEVF